MSRPDRTYLASGVVTDREDEIELRRACLRELIPALAAISLGRQMHLLQQLDSKRVNLPFGKAAALCARNFSAPQRFNAASARMLRAELPVHRNSTL